MNTLNIKVNKYIKNKTNKMVTVGNHYFYKELEFVVIGLTNLKIEENDMWIVGVQYKHASDIDDPSAETFVREKADFEYNFIPAVLEVDMEIALVDEGKVTDTYTVTEVEDDNALAQNKDGIELVFLAGVSPDGKLTVVSPPNEMGDFYVLMPDMQKRVANEAIVNEMLTILTEGSERIEKINIAAPTYDLQESKISLSQTLKIIYTKFGV